MAVKKPSYYKRLASLCKSKTDLKVLSPVGSNTCVHQERAVRTCWHKNVPACIGHVNTATRSELGIWDTTKTQQGSVVTSELKNF